MWVCDTPREFSYNRYNRINLLVEGPSVLKKKLPKFIVNSLACSDPTGLIIFWEGKESLWPLEVAPSFGANRNMGDVSRRLFFGKCD